MEGSRLEGLASWLGELELARTLRRYYPSDHPALEPVLDRFREAAGDMPPGRTLVQVRPRGFFVGERQVTPRARSVQRLASDLFGLGVVGLVVEAPLTQEALQELLDVLSGLDRRSGAEERERLLSGVGAIAGVELIPFDVSLFRFTGDGGAGGEGRALWDLLVSRATGGAASASGEGGLTPREMAELAASAGDPLGFLEILADRLLDLLGEIEERGALLEGLELLRVVREMLDALPPDRRRTAATLLVRQADPMGTLRGRAPELLEPSWFLEGVEALLEAGVALPTAVQRLVYQLAAPAEEAADPWRRGGMDVPPDTVESARRLLRMLPSVSTDGKIVPDPEPARDGRGSIVDRLAERAGSVDLGEVFSPGVLREKLTSILQDAAEAWPEEPVAATADAVLTERYLEYLELGEFERARSLAVGILSRSESAAEKLGGARGVQILLESLSRWGKQYRPRVMAIVSLLGEAGVPSLVAKLTDAEDMTARRRLMEMITAVGADAIPHVVPMLEDDRWYVVRNGLVLLRELGDVRADDRAAGLLEHRNERVVKEAARVLVAAGDDRWARGLDRLLDSDDRRTLDEALAMVRRTRSPDAGKVIAARIERCGPGQLDEPRRLRLIEALGSFDQRETVVALDHVIAESRRPKLFGGHPRLEAAVEAADRLAGPEGPRLLADIAALKDPAAKLANRRLRARTETNR